MVDAIRDRERKEPSVKIVQKKLTDRKPWKGVMRLSKDCGFDPLVKSWADRWALEVSLLIEDYRTREWDQDLLQSLWALQLQTGYVRGFFIHQAGGALKALLGRMAAVTERTPIEEVRSVDAAIQDWRILAVLASLSQQSLENMEWEATFDDFYASEVKVAYYRARSAVFRKDPVERVKIRKRDRKYRRSEKGKATKKAYWQKPEVKARKAEQMRSRRAALKAPAEMSEAAE